MGRKLLVREGCLHRKHLFLLIIRILSSSTSGIPHLLIVGVLYRIDLFKI